MMHPPRCADPPSFRKDHDTGHPCGMQSHARPGSGVAGRGCGSYDDAMDKRPAIDGGDGLQDPAAKILGRRRIHDPFRYGMKLQETGRELWQTFGIRVPRGVYRFRSHEEADAWLIDRMIAATRD